VETEDRAGPAGLAFCRPKGFLLRHSFEDATAMPTNRIAVVQGAPGAVVDDLLATAVARWSPQLRIAGVVAEGDGLAKGKWSAGNLRTLASGKLFSIFAQDNPDAGLDACNVDGRGAIAAAEVAEHDIARGCDLVVLNRYAKLEQAGEGLCRAFAAAIAARVPLLTSVSPDRTDAFAAFAATGFTLLPPDAAAIDAWVDAVRSPADTLG
jgi:hypothetical protein